MMDRYDRISNPSTDGEVLFNLALTAEETGYDNIAKLQYKRSAETGCTRAMINLGLIYTNGDDSEKSQVENLFSEAAELGDPSGMRNLAYINAVGICISVNKELATKWYAKSAESGNIKAQCNYANMLRSGIGISKNLGEAVKWYEKSAESGYFRAQASLAAMYLSGNGVKADPEKAFYWYSKAAKNGSKRGMYNLGLMYYDGNGTDRDVDRAEMLYRSAAEKGYSKAMFALGEVLEARGRPEEALEWYISGASKGESRCINRLDGLSVPVPEYTGRK
jgi:TPR repeat protein